MRYASFRGKMHDGQDTFIHFRAVSPFSSDIRYMLVAGSPRETHFNL